MFRNYLAAALRNLARNRLYAAISIVGLAVGMAAAILTGLYIRDELTFDHFIPGHEHVYVVASQVEIPGRARIVQPLAPDAAPSWLRQDFPGVVAARLIHTSANVRHGEVEAIDTVAWVDPDFFRVLPMTAVAGDPDAAVRQADGVVLTRSMARKYFGRDDPVGESLDVISRDRPMRVRAVVEDLPRNSHIAQQIFVSALAAASPQRAADATPYRRGDFYVSGMTYARFPGGASAARAVADMSGLVRRHMNFNGRWDFGLDGGLSLVALDRLHLFPFTGSNMSGATPQGDPAVLWSLAMVGGLILVMAAVNFVNLTTARAARRAVEVGVRKASGAERRHLVVQFIGEAVIYALAAMVCAAALVELGLPGLNALLLRNMNFQPWRDPALMAAVVALALGLGLLGGIYPALVLSSFRPAAVLKGGVSRTSGSPLIRNGLVTLQFAALIGLILSAAVIFQQTRFVLGGALRLATDQVVVLSLRPVAGPGAVLNKPLCRNALLGEVRKLPGVAAAACSSALALDQGDANTNFILPDGSKPLMAFAPVDAGFFELYGIKPVAGRLLSPGPADEPTGIDPVETPPPNLVINTTAARLIGFKAAAGAVGAPLRFAADTTGRASSRIVGVVPDFTFDLAHGVVRPMVYFVRPTDLNQLSIRLNGRDVAGAIAGIDRLWARLGEPRAVQRRFLSEELADVYAGVIRQASLIIALAAVAVFIAILGLFGLAAFTAERRTKEIGVRKAMGASTREVMQLLLWQFTRPVLWANLIAWPAAWWAMDRWLQGFARRVELQPWQFLAASAAALAIAWLTVFAHTLKVARAKPIDALRYE